MHFANGHLDGKSDAVHSIFSSNKGMEWWGAQEKRSLSRTATEAAASVIIKYSLFGTHRHSYFRFARRVGAELSSFGLFCISGGLEHSLCSLRSTVFWLLFIQLLVFLCRRRVQMKSACSHWNAIDWLHSLTAQQTKRGAYLFTAFSSRRSRLERKETKSPMISGHRKCWKPT